MLDPTFPNSSLIRALAVGSPVTLFRAAPSVHVLYRSFTRNTTWRSRPVRACTLITSSKQFDQTARVEFTETRRWPVHPEGGISYP
ncbi:unnamed protein product [Danaus chrysippus]|uniref:(African queen) hypothetical protein n=1 Tax=Danaus chrysippus TaxID=151541 RepID=A0A8J2QJ37_9NEOP|nr:unnamed protein product [Danaus chrysippus]